MVTSIGLKCNTKMALHRRQSASGSGSVIMATGKTRFLLALAVFMLHSAQAGDPKVSNFSTVLFTQI
jgi:hypothetical protein